MSRSTDRAAVRPLPSGPTYRIAMPFDGHPYLVTRIGRTALRHLAVVPADWSRERLVDLACRQAAANQLETCVCLGPDDAVFVAPGGTARTATFVPTGIALTDRLVVAGPVPDTAEQATRRAALRAYVEHQRNRGYLVGDGLEGGRVAEAGDIDRLSGPRIDGLPPGLRRCPVCGEPRGEHLALHGLPDLDGPPQVVEVTCRCANHNRCAGCGAPLADHRLSAYAWHADRAEVLYVAAYCGLGHRCG